jgi:DNA primase
MDALTIPAGARKVILFADRDQPGHDAAKRAVEKYRGVRAVEVEFPPEGCGDFADEAEADLGVCDE